MKLKPLQAGIQQTTVMETQIRATTNVPGAGGAIVDGGAHDKHGESDVVQWRWYVVHCNPLKELDVGHALRDYLGLIAYVPTVKRRLRGTLQPAPFFPGYVFVQANLNVISKSRINSAPGVVRLLDSGGTPLPLQLGVVEAIRERVDHLNANGGLPTHDFKPGDNVLLKSGPLRGLQAVFLGPMKPGARVKVLLEFLGRQNEIKVDAHALEKAHGNSSPLPSPSAIPLPPKRERGTRGKGRKINS